MTGHHFMLADVAATIGAVCLYPLFVFSPGYVAAWLADLFGFRRRTLAFQIALSIPLSIAISPVVIYLAGRFGSMTAVWALYAACWIGFVPIIARSGRRFDRQWLGVAGIGGAWIVLAVFSLVDLQFGNRAYYPMLALDYGIRTQFIHSIQVTGIPPANPFFFPGHTVPLRYHYFWLLVCSLPAKIVGPRTAWMGGVVWCGLGFLAVIALYVRLFGRGDAASLRRRVLIAISLTCVAGLDIVPTALLWCLRLTGMKTAVFPIMQFWNEQVFGFVSTALWTAHHLASLIACLVALLLLVDGRVKYACFAGVAMVSAAGMSIYVAFTFGIFLAVWAGV